MRLLGLASLDPTYGVPSARAHLGAHPGAQVVDHGEALGRLDVPEGPAVARLEPLRERADAVDRADAAAVGERAVCPHQCRVAPLARRAATFLRKGGRGINSGGDWYSKVCEYS